METKKQQYLLSEYNGIIQYCQQTAIGLTNLYNKNNEILKFLYIHGVTLLHCLNNTTGANKTKLGYRRYYCNNKRHDHNRSEQQCQPIYIYIYIFTMATETIGKQHHINMVHTNILYTNTENESIYIYKKIQ